MAAVPQCPSRELGSEDPIHTTTGRSRCFLGEHSGGVQVWARNRAACIQILALPMSHKVSESPVVT